jgi:hypothetical protein
VIVDPSTGVEICVMVVALGVGVADAEGGCVEDEEENNSELDELKVEEDLDDGVVLICVEDDEELGRKLEEDEMVEESEEETGVGRLLAIELDDIWEELDGAEGVGVDDAAAREGVLVELELDIVNCLRKTSLLGCL